MTDQTSLQTVPVLRRLWMVVLLTCLVIPFPLAMIMILSGPVYRWREEGWEPIGNGPRYVYGGLLALWLAAVVGRLMFAPGTASQDWTKSANPDQVAAARPAVPAKTNTRPAEVPAAGGVKASNYEDPSPTNVGQASTGNFPPGQREYFDTRSKLLAAAKAAGEGTRTYDENWKQIEALNASMNGKEVHDWICIIPAGDGGTIRENMRGLSCNATNDDTTRYKLFFDDTSLLNQATYPGDVLSVSGTIENKGSGWIAVHPNAAAIMEKSK